MANWTEISVALGTLCLVLVGLFQARLAKPPSTSQILEIQRLRISLKDAGDPLHFLANARLLSTIRREFVDSPKQRYLRLLVAQGLFALLITWLSINVLDNPFSMTATLIALSWLSLLPTALDYRNARHAIASKAWDQLKAWEKSSEAQFVKSTEPAADEES